MQVRISKEAHQKLLEKKFKTGKSIKKILDEMILKSK